MDNLEEKDQVENREESSVKFTQWANEPTVTNLKQDYTDASSDHDAKVSRIDTWLDNLNITGAALKKKIKGRSNVTPKLIRKQAEWRYASLSEPFLSTEDVFNTDPVTYEDKKASIQNGLLLNSQFNTKIQKVKFFDEFVRTVVDEGTVICRTGWNFIEEEVEEEQPVYEMMAIEDEAIAMQMIQNGEEPLEPVQTGTETVTVLKTVKNHPTVEICDYKNITIDPTCLGDLEKAKFIIYSFDTSLSELERDGKYKNLDRIDVETNNILGEPDFYNKDDSSFNFTDKPRKKFVAYEYWGFWDYDDTGIVKPFVATWVGNTMIRLEENPFPDEALPFVSVQYLPVRKSIYGEPDGELLKENQDIIGAVSRGMIDIMGRSANGQQASRKDALDAVNKSRFDRGLDYEFNSQVDPKQAFHTHTYPEIPRSAHEMLAIQYNDAESMTGVKAFASDGITGQALGENVGGIKSALDATAKRELAILRRLAEGVKQIGRKFISMNGEFLSEEEIVRVTNEEFVPIRRDDLAGNIDLSLTISTPEADNEKAHRLEFMLQTMGNNMDPAMSQMILTDIARLRKMPALAKQIEEYEPQPDPLVQEEQRLKVELLKAQIANEYAKAEENTANANLDNAKAGTEGNKARSLASDADKKDLDFIEQESGVTQERDLQKGGAQADANKELRAIDHVFNMREKAAGAVDK